jgi:hypothetical protein
VSREATQLEKHEWWMAYGLDLRGFVPGGDGRGIVHWMADAYAHQEARAVLIRVCDMIWNVAEWGQLPDEEVSCMACVAQSCRPQMRGGIL